MKKTLLLASIILAILLAGCKDDVITTGTSVLPDSDGILVGCDTFGVASELIQANAIYASSDSMLLGESDNMFGTIHADILTQFACPIGFEYPDNSEVDSVILFLYYYTWYGDGKTPMSISAYEMDKGTFEYSKPYASNLDLNDFWSGEDSTYVLEKDRIIVASEPTDSIYSSMYVSYLPYISMKMSADFAKRLFACNDFSTQEAFNNAFHGLYIRSNFGSATVLHIAQINMALYYHFSYEKTNGEVDTVTDVKSFFANSEIRKINRVEYTQSTFEKLAADEDVNYIVSPAHMCTKIRFPMANMSNHIKESLGDKRPYVNLAQLYIEVLNVFTGATKDKTFEDYAQPAACMLLIKESAAERFFTKHELPSDTCAILGNLDAFTDSLGNTVYGYKYDLSTLLTRELRDSVQTDSLDMLLIPVSVATTTTASSSYYSSASTSISGVSEQQTISVTKIRSAKNADAPMKLEVVYSGF